MTQILARCKVTIAAVEATQTTPASPEENYYFLSTYGVYAGTIATATGVTAEDADTDFSDEVITPVKALLRQGVLSREVVIVKDDAGKKYRKTLLVGIDQAADFDTLIVDDIWPVGKGAAGKFSTLQQVLGVHLDGIPGHQTYNELNSWLSKPKNENVLLHNYFDIREADYRRWGVASQSVFLTGWLNRSRALKTYLQVP